MNWYLNLLGYFSLLGRMSLPSCGRHPSCDLAVTCSFRIFTYHSLLSGIDSRTVQCYAFLGSVWVFDSGNSTSLGCSRIGLVGVHLHIKIGSCHRSFPWLHYQTSCQGFLRAFHCPPLNSCRCQTSSSTIPSRTLLKLDRFLGSSEALVWVPLALS